jgi:hypothetical protein
MSLSLSWVTGIADQPHRLAVHRAFRPLQQPGVSELISSLPSLLLDTVLAEKGSLISPQLLKATSFFCQASHRQGPVPRAKWLVAADQGEYC